MNVVKTLAFIGVAVCGVLAWNAFTPEGGMREAIDGVRGQAGHDDGSFVELPLPDGVSARGVVIFAPQDCPSEAAQRARQLASTLSAQNIPYRETSSADFSALSSQEEAERVMAVMEGPIPIVYVNGRAKANPTVEQVVAEYRRGSSG
jgi:hypothetical protein